MNRADELVEELRENEHILQVCSTEQLLHSFLDSKSRFVSAANYAAPLKDVAIAAKLIRSFGVQPGRVVLREYAGKQYVIFKGPPGQRKILRGTRYLANNPKVVRVAIGPRGIIESVKGGFVLTVVLSTGVEVFDYVLRDTATLAQLLGNVSGQLIKLGISSAAGAVAGLLSGGVTVLGSTAAVPLVIAIAVGVLTGVFLAAIDKRIGVTRALIEGYKALGVDLENIAHEAGRTIRHAEDNPGSFIRKLFQVPTFPGSY